MFAWLDKKHLLVGIKEHSEHGRQKAFGVSVLSGAGQYFHRTMDVVFRGV